MLSDSGGQVVRHHSGWLMGPMHKFEVDRGAILFQEDLICVCRFSSTVPKLVPGGNHTGILQHLESMSRVLKISASEKSIMK